MSHRRYLARADWFDPDVADSTAADGGQQGHGAGSGIDQRQRRLDTLIRMADEHRPRCEWALCPPGERENPELTVDKRAEVHLKWRQGALADHDFAVLHRLDYQVWDAWLQLVRLEGVATVIKEPPELLTRNGVSYEMALAAVFEALGDEKPERFGVLYL